MSLVREKETIIAIMVGCLVLYEMFSLTWMWITALAIGLAASCRTPSARVIDKVWFWIAEDLGSVMSRVILAHPVRDHTFAPRAIGKNIPQRFHDVERELQQLFYGKITPVPTQGS